MNRPALHCCYAIVAAGALLPLASSTLANPPINDNCANATVITDVDFLGYEDYLNDATVQICEADSPCDNSVDINHSTWYQVTPPGAGQLVVSAHAFGNSSMPLVVALFDGCAFPVLFNCNQPSCLACDASAGFPYEEASFTQPVLGGQTYLIKLASDDLPDGTVVIEVQYHPYVPNSACGGALAINGDEFVDERDVTLAQDVNCTNAGPACNAGALNHSVWYRYDATEDCTLQIDTINSSYSTVLTAFSGCPVDSQILGCVFPPVLGCNMGNPWAFMTLEVTAGQTYFIRASASSVETEYMLTFNCNSMPGNDHCGGATPITANSFHPPSLLITYADSTSSEPQEACESGDDGVSNSVFYSFTAPSAGTATINTFGSSYDTVLSVYGGCGTIVLPNTYIPPTQLACHNNVGGIFGLASAISNLPMQAGHDYIIKVSGNNPDPDAGMLDFNFEFTPTPSCPADISGDGQVNTSDLLMVINNWGAAGSNPADVNHDNVVNSGDLLAVINAWGPCS